MKHLKFAMLVLGLFPILLSAQGIRFEQGNWSEVVAKAKQENKLIYMDVYASWCGPCKMMARDVFPDEKAGAKYNELFINYKIDAEKGEGKTIAKKYGISSYPTNLYINPDDESVVYRVAGACGVDEFLNRADIAQLDFKDPLSWEDYEAKLSKNPKDYHFLMQYVGKAGRLGKENDKAIDAYVTHHMNLPPHDSNLYFLYMNTTNFDNKGYPILKANKDRVNAMVADPRQKFEEREKAYYFQGTFKKAVDHRDIRILETIKPVLFAYNPDDTTGKWLWAEQMYYNAIQDKEGLMASYEKAIKYYGSFSEKELNSRDSMLLLTNIQNLRNQPKYKKMTEEQFRKQVDNQTKNGAFSKAFSTNALNAYVNGISYSILEFKSDKRRMKEALKWSEEGMKLVRPEMDAWEKMMQLKAQAQYYAGRKEDARETAEDLVSTLSTHNKDTKQSQNILDKIKSRQL